MRIKLTLAYDGRAFAGSQSQVGGNTVQDHLERALEETAKCPVRLHLAGRTDAGVHAAAQIGHFDAPDHLSMNPYNWLPALNAKLPATLRVMDCEEVPLDFHSRFSATGKTYQYRICTLPVLPPLQAGLAWHIPKLFDFDVLQQALSAYLGRHRFVCFAAVRGNETADTDFHRTITEARAEALTDGYLLTFTGEGFFYRMVRIMTGAAVAVAQGKMSMEQLCAYIDPGDVPYSTTCSHCAPADGLTLTQVWYDALK
ncbi:MAG: tRNA pseudouridine(38-40) synthase TruA [Verrucomicrobia bacterium]|jgi:tRNA pseudouridine38-40 synthase|nr:MAG: tRNA pseudouridine(38-40) synthase TruA [Verrucomicrobiota bacterium]